MPPRTVAQHAALALNGRRGEALGCDEAVDPFEARALDDAMVAGGVLHQPVAGVTAQDVSTNRSCHAERHLHALGEHGHWAIPVRTGLAANCPWKRIVLRVEPVAGHAPPIAGRASD